MAKRGRKKAGKTPVVLIICLFAAAAAAVGIGITLLSGNSYSDVRLEQNECFGITENTQAAIVENGILLEEKAIYEDGRIYLPYDLVSALPGNVFYYDSELRTLLLTLQTENYTWQDASGVLKLSGGTPYVSAETVQQYSDAEIGIYTDPARVTIRTKWKDIVYAQAAEDTQLRCDPNKKGSIVAEIPAGTKLIVSGDEEKNWSFLSMEDGYFGYIETDKLFFDEPVNLTHEVNPLTAFDRISLDETVKMVWHYVDVQENNDILDYMLEDTGEIRVICPTWLTVKNANGDISSLADKNYAENIRKRGMKLWTMVSDYLGADSSTGDILMNAASRANLEEQILNVIEEYALDGVNIDFETITEEQAPAFVQFLRELSVQTHKMGVVLSVDNFVPTYTAHYNRTAQAKTVDYLVIMGYDEHTEYSSEPGSVASLPFVREGIEQTLTEVSAQQIILGVPFYTRSWISPFGTDYFETTALSMPAAEEFIKEKNITLAWDETLGQNYGESRDDSAVYRIWMEDAQSLNEKLQLLRSYGLAGASAWRLGLENPDVWQTWNSSF